MLRTIDLTDREIHLINISLLDKLSKELDSFEVVTDTSKKKSLQNIIYELKSLRTKFVDLL